MASEIGQLGLSMKLFDELLGRMQPWLTDVLYRCVQISLPPTDVEDLAAWPEVINKLKESIVTAFDGAILEREDEVKRGEAQRLTVGWNFCTWFLLKVGPLIYTGAVRDLIRNRSPTPSKESTSTKTLSSFTRSSKLPSFRC